MTLARPATNLALARANGAFVLRSAPLAAPGDDTVRFSMRCAAVCGTDRQIARGDRGDPAAVLGHEGVAEVIATGSGVRAPAIGARVVFNPVNPLDQDEILGHSTPGLFQQSLDVPAAELDRRSLVEPVAHDLPDERAVLAEPLGTVVYTHELRNGLRTSAPRSLLIFGAGPIGILHALYASRTEGVAAVRLVCNSEARARWLAGTRLLPSVDVVLVPGAAGASDGALLRERLGGDRPDAVLLCTPGRATPAALAAALRLIDDGGTIGLVGGAGRAHADELPGIDLVQLRRENVCGLGPPHATEAVLRDGRRVSLFGQRGTARRHLRRAMALLGADPTFARVLTHRVPLAALPAALPAIAQGHELAGTHCVKALVDFGAERAAIEPLPTGGRA